MIVRGEKGFVFGRVGDDVPDHTPIKLLRPTYAANAPLACKGGVVDACHSRMSQSWESTPFNSTN